MSGYVKRRARSQAWRAFRATARAFRGRRGMWARYDSAPQYQDGGSGGRVVVWLAEPLVLNGVTFGEHHSRIVVSGDRP